MIFKIELPSVTEYCTAKNVLHLLQSYEKEYEGFHEIESVTEITDEQAKEIQLFNDEYDEENPDEMPQYISLFDSAIGDDFAIIGSSEW